MDHKCPAPGCERGVDGDMLACSTDWYRVPKPLRDAVWRAWRRGAGRGSTEHTKAIGLAIDWLQRNAAPVQ
jgi:hypothetical protein